MNRTNTGTQIRTKTPRRLALGLLAALAVTVATVAAPVAGSARGHSVSVNGGVAGRGTVRDASLARTTGEEIPSRAMSVAGGSGHGSHSAGAFAGSMA
jgi:hypothetical protein